MKFYLWLALAAFGGLLLALAGCNDCGNLWFMDCPSPVPGPSPSPIPPAPFGTVVASWPSAVAGSWGSIDFRDGEAFEYCRGQAKLYFRDVHTGEILRAESLDGRLTNCWAVAWDKFISCYWATNPPPWHGWESGQCNLIQVSPTGEVMKAVRVSDNWDKPALIIRDCDMNESYYWHKPGAPEEEKIEPGLLLTSDWHYSIRKQDAIRVASDMWEQFWCRLGSLQVAGITHVGTKILAATDGDNPISGQYPIIEFDQPGRKEEAAKTGRKIVVPGVWFSSLKYDAAIGPYLWGKGINKATGESRIYKISLDI